MSAPERVFAIDALEPDVRLRLQRLRARLGLPVAVKAAGRRGRVERDIHGRVKKKTHDPDRPRDEAPEERGPNGRRLRDARGRVIFKSHDPDRAGRQSW